MATITKCIAEKITEVPNALSGTNLSGMVLANGVSYCVKSKNHIDGVTDSCTVYQYNDYEVAEATKKKFQEYISYGMTFNPYTKKLYIASGSKVLAVKVDGLEFFSDYDVAETTTQAITYYKDNKEILMANSLNTDEYFCFMVGKLSSHRFNKLDEFYVAKSDYVDSAGYTKFQDIYYNGTNGLFIVTNYYDTSYSSCKNRILRVDMKTAMGTYNDKNVYGIVEILDIDFDTSVYTQCNIESMSLDKYGRLVFVCNASGNGGDAFYRVTNRTFKMRTSTEFTCTTKKATLIPNAIPGSLGEKVTYLTGMAINGNTIYYTKSNSSSSGVGLYRANVTAGNCEEPILLENSAKRCFGMTYYNNYLYLSFRDEIRRYSLAGVLDKTISANGKKIDAIAHLQGNDFLVMQYKPVNGKLCFRIWDLSGSSVVEKDWFYVTNDDIEEYGGLQDIYYHPLHGLFISTNHSSVTYKNLILRVDLTYYMKERGKGMLLNGDTLPVTSKWHIDFSAENYKGCNIESLVITNEGKMLVACNVTKQSTQTGEFHTDDGTFFVENITFRMDRPGFYINSALVRTLPSKEGIKCVPACLAINGRKMYCITTNTETDLESYFMMTNDYRNEEFELNLNKIEGAGHCNGGTYHKNILYSCDYKKPSQHKIGLFLLNGDPDLFNSERISILTDNEKIYGAIAYYKDDKFLLVNYSNSDKGGYAEYIRVDLGTFFYENSYEQITEVNDYLSIKNPLFISGNEIGWLQDGHYEPGIGLFLGGIFKVSENSESEFFILRIDIDSYIDADNREEIYPSEIYFLKYNGKNREVESMVMSEFGELLVSLNVGSNDVLVAPNEVFFNREL